MIGNRYRPNRLQECPECGGPLGGDKTPYITEEGTAFRTRKCRLCGVTVYSKQKAEELTGVECCQVHTQGS